MSASDRLPASVDEFMRLMNDRRTTDEELISAGEKAKADVIRDVKFDAFMNAGSVVLTPEQFGRVIHETEKHYKPAEGKAGGFRGKVNVYICERCTERTVTRDMAYGVTPFVTSCTQPRCKGAMQSMCYRVPQDLTPTHHWVRLSYSEYAASPEHTRAHVERGGLVLREI